MDFDSHSSWRFKAPIVRRGLRGKKTSLRAYRDMSNTDIRLHVESTGSEDLGEAVRARGVQAPWFRDGRRSRGKRGSL